MNSFTYPWADQSSRAVMSCSLLQNLGLQISAYADILSKLSKSRYGIGC